MGKMGNKKSTDDRMNQALQEEAVASAQQEQSQIGRQTTTGHTHGGYTYATTGTPGYATVQPNVYTTGTTTASQGFVQYATPHYQQQYPTGTQVPFYHPPTEVDPPMSPEEREMAIEFIENVMFLLVSRLDECDVPNKGGMMDHGEYAPIESVIDLGEYEIVIRPKT